MSARILPDSWAPTEAKLARVCDAAGLSASRESTLTLFRDMVTHCRLREPKDPPRWSGLTDDSSPIEISVVFTRHGCQLRLLFEPQADPQAPLTYWKSGQRLTRYLTSRCHASTDAARAIEPLFRPDAHDVFLSMGHAFEPMPAQPPKCKVYFNAMARGTEHTQRIVGTALSRLGFERTWERLGRVLTPRDRVELLALDLTPQGRVKLYVRPMGATLQHLMWLAGLATAGDERMVARAWHRMHPARQPERSRPTFITYHFTDPSDRAPSRAVLSVPLFPGLRSDLVASRRITSLFEDLDLDPMSYLACVRAMADGPLSKAQGIQSYVAVQMGSDAPAIVVYFNPRLYASRYGWLARAPKRAWSSPVTAAREKAR